MKPEEGKKRVVITGLGVVSPNGIGKDEFWGNCFAGVSGIKPITLFDTSKYRCHWAGEISGFQPEQYLGPKGLRNLDRTTLLALVAAKLAIEDAKLEITDTNRTDIGVVLGSTMGSVHSISEFDKTSLREGPRYVNPALFPNTVINSPASQVAIRFGLKGLNSTIATGFSASLDSIGYAMDMLRLERAKVLLVGGVEELCIETFLGFYKLGMLATSQNETPPFYGPFDPRHCGTLLGEGAVFVVMESLESAKRRGSNIYAELLGYSSGFRSESLFRYDPEARGPVTAIEQTLTDASTRAEDIDYLSACANSTKAWDDMELTAFRTIFGSRADTLAMTADKALLGESFSAGAAFQLASTLGVLTRQQVPFEAGIRSYEDAHAVSHEPTASLPFKTALVDSFGLTGVSSALIVGCTSGA